MTEYRVELIQRTSEVVEADSEDEARQKVLDDPLPDFAGEPIEVEDVKERWA